MKLVLVFLELIQAVGKAHATFQLLEVAITQESHPHFRESGKVTNYPTHVRQSREF